MPLPPELAAVYRKQGYQLVGRYGLVKPCHWVRKSLRTRGREFCYKQRFYGVPSHRCMQVSVFPGCSQRCLYCWRVMPEDIGIQWNELSVPDFDEPEELLDQMIEAHRRAVSGYKGWPGVDPKMWEEARNPVHLTPSLVGEPTLYGAERLSRFFAYAYKRGFKSIFLVTNGNFPEVLERLDVEPTQLYISVSAPDKETHRKVSRPRLPDAWERVLRSLELMSSFSCPTVMRITVVKGLNMHSPEIYAKLIDRANPTYVEVKAAMALGYFTKRLPVDAMPRHEEVKRFALQIAEHCGYKLIDEQLPSRVVLLSRLERPIKLF